MVEERALEVALVVDLGDEAAVVVVTQVVVVEIVV
jgi:hypothetical protein